MTGRVQLPHFCLDKPELAFAVESFPLWRGTVTIMVTEHDRIKIARTAVDEVVADIDAACSAHRADSELTKVNNAGGRPVAVGATFHAVLWTALHAADVTDGLVDPTAGSARGDWRSIRVDEPAGTVTLPAGARLDFGSVAKAFAADRAAELAAGQAACGVLVDIAGDVATAGPAPIMGWPVRVPCGDSLRQPGQEVIVREHSGIATSSIEARMPSPVTRGVVPHIVDPRSGLHVLGPWHTVSVAAGTCVDADTASTAAIVRGHEAVDWLTSRGLPARLVHVDGWTAMVGGWPGEADWTEAAANWAEVEADA